MSNLFFKSESVKNSVKSGLNFVSNRVLKVFLLMSMMLLSWNGWGQGYTVIYPDGKTMAEPGDVVTVVFDEDVSEYYFSNSKTESHSNKGSGWGILGWDSKECRDENVLEPAQDYVTTGYSKQGNKVTFSLPLTFSGSVYELHYGTKEHTYFSFIVCYRGACLRSYVF